MINSFGEGGLDYFGQIAPTLIGMRLLPSDFRYEALRGSRQPINELGERVPAALIPQNHLVEAYAARLAPANDAFKQVAREAGFDVEGLDLYVERAWTMAFFAATGSAREILQGLAEERGSLDDIFTSDDLARWDIIRRARVSAAEAYMLDRLLER
jgi:hypothetical protein